MSPATANPAQSRARAAHAAARALQRYRVELSPADVAEIARRVAACDRRTIHLYARAGGGRLVAVGWAGRWLGAVYDAAAGEVATFLPESAFAAHAAYLDGLDPATGDPRLPATAYRPADAWPDLPPESDPAALRDHLRGCGTWARVVAARRLAIEAGEETRWTRAWADREARALAERTAALRARLARGEALEAAAACGVADPDDPDALLAAARRAVRGLERRAGGLDAAERAVVFLIGRRLSRTA